MRNVNEIIPQPFKRFHHKYMRAGNLNGSVLMHKSVRPIVCEIKCGSLFPIEIGVRLAKSLEHGFQYIGVLNFHKSSKDQTEEDIILSLNQEGKIIQSSSKTCQYLNPYKNVKEQIPILKQVLPHFDMITELKNSPKYIARIAEQNIRNLQSDTELEVPYAVLEPLKWYLIYSGDYKKNKISAQDFTSVKFKMQEDSNILLYNRASETTSSFEVTISDFWNKGDIEGRFVIFHRSLERYKKGNRSLQFFLSYQESLKIWEVWQDKVYEGMVLEKTKSEREKTILKVRKLGRNFSGILKKDVSQEHNEKGNKGKETTADQLDHEKSLPKPPPLKAKKSETNVEAYLEAEEGSVLELKNFGSTNNLDTMRKCQSTKSISNEVDDNLNNGADLVDNQLELMEWINENEKLDSERRSKNGESLKNRTFGPLIDTDEQLVIVEEYKGPEETEQEVEFTKKSKPVRIKIEKAPSSNNSLKKTLSSSKGLPQKVSDQEKIPLTTPRSVDQSKLTKIQTFGKTEAHTENDEKPLDLNTNVQSRAKMHFNSAANKIIKKTMKQRDKLTKEEIINNWQPSAGHSVSTVHMTNFVSIKKSVSYLVHHHPYLKVNSNNWGTLFKKTVEISSYSIGGKCDSLIYQTLTPCRNKVH